ncbi:hypothetical protein B0H16DRAFT_1742372 [Mycena metata]|uniref:Uncharacterized protein n=1 Tax=Mycena metata TaxID=1033252 RepID=A0AAD7H8X4_9AGAR|nr:hypothetical protein B0H16DRAFT_1742372 [Mycena metata]
MVHGDDASAARADEGRGMTRAECEGAKSYADTAILRPGIQPKLAALRALYEGKKIIVGRDKLDVVKGCFP